MPLRIGTLITRSSPGGPDDAVGSVRSPLIPTPNRCVGSLLPASAAVADAAMAAMAALAREGGEGSGLGLGVVVGGSGAGGDPVEGSPILAGPGVGAAGAARAALPHFPAEHPENRCKAKRFSA